MQVLKTRKGFFFFFSQKKTPWKWLKHKRCNILGSDSRYLWLWSQETFLPLRPHSLWKQNEDRLSNNKAKHKQQNTQHIFPFLCFFNGIIYIFHLTRRIINSFSTNIVPLSNLPTYSTHVLHQNKSLTPTTLKWASIPGRFYYFHGW